MKSESKEGKDPSFKLYRMIDANLNRLREGIRVCEDIERYLFDNQILSQKLKSLRHRVRVSNLSDCLEARDIAGDVLKKTTASESKREDVESLLLSNIKRAQESARVLEESLKLIDVAEAERFKEIRYALYDLEKEIFSV
ncbi:MAG: thiamine-phosphate pyrophosphorylase [Campylobacteraceae bacterium 4484_4]|nr:MAG: thiamine-phosphate pyrophosphorylase [Campylobacteraceae bacterium 4484_4]